jgi:outer membrane scaffolding protein for murein synthesis (MipA/OmpV family)
MVVPWILCGRVMTVFLSIPMLIWSHQIGSAEKLPLWEFGAGVFPSTYPIYRGSKDQESHFLLFPYIVYRGEILKADRDGVRALLYKSSRAEIDVSLGGAIPVDSDKSAVRSGMPDLDPVFETGPSLNILLLEPSARSTLKLKLPARYAIATDFRSFESAGWIFNPHLTFDSHGLFGGWSASMSFGPVMASKKYHAYYYDVAANFSTPSRMQYSVSGGYSGSSMLASLSRRFDEIWVGGFVRYDQLSGAVFEDSPLVEQDHSLMAGFAIARRFKASGVQVDVQ